MTKLTEGMSYERYMQLYTVAYNYCISTGMGASSGISSGVHLVGGELYTRVAQYFRTHLERMAEAMQGLTGEELLRQYSVEWERYTQGANFVHRLLIYLNRHWVKHEREDGRTDVHTIYTWKRYVFQPLQTQAVLTDTLLHQIRVQRDGGVVATALLKSVLGSYVSLGIDDYEATRVNLDVYRDEFQQSFLLETEEYYRAESTGFLLANPVADYMRKAQARLAEEMDRVGMYLHESTRRPLEAVCREEIVTKHAAVLCAQFEPLLENERYEDLGRMYELFAPIAGGLDPLRKQFEEYVLRVGHDAVAKTMDESADAVDPRKYVQVVLGVYQHHAHIIQVAFRSEPGMHVSLDKACGAFINDNKVTRGSSSKGPELLAKYVDSLLKKSSKVLSEASMEEALDQAMIVFRYIDDRDYFQKFYSKFLARRLVTFASASIDAEESMIAKLKEVCGFEYTNKLQRMFTEVGMCRELNERFKETTAASAPDVLHSMDFYGMVLADGVWPLQAPSTDFRVPAELQPIYDTFMQFYGTQHTHRVVTWLWHLSSNDVHTTYLPQKHILQTSTYQCAVLLLFNSDSVLTFDEIASATRLEPGVLKNTLLPLTKSKVLHELDDSYSLNMDFKSKKVRVNLQIPVRAEQKTESADVAKTVQEDRKMLLQATIVRIMKARKTMKHNMLLPEVITFVQSRFNPKVSDIKKAIDALIEREYLQRDDTEMDLYSYVA